MRQSTRQVVIPVLTGSTAFALIVLVLPQAGVHAKLLAGVYFVLLIAGGMGAVMVDVRRIDRQSRAALTPDQRRRVKLGNR